MFLQLCSLVPARPLLLQTEDWFFYGSQEPVKSSSVGLRGDRVPQKVAVSILEAHFCAHGYHVMAWHSYSSRAGEQADLRLQQLKGQNIPPRSMFGDPLYPTQGVKPRFGLHAFGKGALT